MSGESEASEVRAAAGTGKATWLWVPVAWSLAVVVLWGFPRFWYTKTDPAQSAVWLEAQTQFGDWAYRPVPVGESAEALLVADELQNGEFRDSAGRTVRAFSAKRFKESGNEIGLFIHTPDRCWTQAGWKLEPVEPDYKEIQLHGVSMVFERRIFSFGGARELVYFGGLVGGQALPYRLDHNLSVGLKFAREYQPGSSAVALRASDGRFWSRVWDAFVNRRPLIGPKQFIRISTPLEGERLEEADRLLTRFLSEWLRPVPYKGAG